MPFSSPPQRPALWHPKCLLSVLDGVLPAEVLSEWVLSARINTHQDVNLAVNNAMLRLTQVGAQLGLTDSQRHAYMAALTPPYDPCLGC